MAGHAIRSAIGAAMAALWLAHALPLDAQAGAARKAPSVPFKTLDGGTVRLADLKGHVVLVDFWASWCAPCKATFPALNALSQEVRDKGVEILAVNEDEKRKDRDRFLEGATPSLRVLIDARGDAARAFGVQAIPSMFVVDRAGAIVFSHPNYAAGILEVVKQELASLTEEPGAPSPRTPSVGPRG